MQQCHYGKKHRFRRQDFCRRGRGTTTKVKTALQNHEQAGASPTAFGKQTAHVPQVAVSSSLWKAKIRERRNILVEDGMWWSQQKKKKNKCHATCVKDLARDNPFVISIEADETAG